MLSILKDLLRQGALLGLVLAIAFFCVGVQGLLSSSPSTAYADRGVYTFVPVAVRPTPVRTRGNGRLRRLHPTTTVYVVDYEADDGSGYQYHSEGSQVEELARQLFDRGPVRRRVLSIPDEGVYITVDPGQTAASYAAGEFRKYWLMVGLSILYAAALAGGWFYLSRRGGA